MYSEKTKHKKENLEKKKKERERENLEGSKRQATPHM